MATDVYARAADIFIEREIPHVCWAVAIADGYDSRDYLNSPATREFQDLFAAPGAQILQSGDILGENGTSEDAREFSLWLLAMAAAVAAHDSSA